MVSTRVQAPRRSCISAANLPHNHVLLVSTEDDTKPITKKVTNELRDAVIMHAKTNEIVKKGDIRFATSMTFYFAQATQYPGFSYVLMYINRVARYGCSCSENRRFSFCQHQAMAEEVGA